MSNLFCDIYHYRLMKDHDEYVFSVKMVDSFICFYSGHGTYQGSLRFYAPR